MSHNVTESPTFDSNVEVPDEGDVIVAFSNNAGEGPVGPGMVALADRTSYLRGRADMAQGAFALMAGRVQRPYLRSTATTLSVGPFVAVVLNPAAPNGYSLVSTATEVTLSAANIEDGGAFVPDTWYFAYVSAGGVYVLSTTAPDAANRFKAGDTSKVYLGCVRAIAGPALVPIHAEGGRYAFDEPQVIATGLNATSWTSESLASRIPPTASLAAILMTGSNSAQVSRTASLRPKGSAVTTTPVLTVMAGCAVDLVPNYAPGIGQFSGLVGVDSTQSVEYETSHATLSVALAVSGFQEP